MLRLEALPSVQGYTGEWEKHSEINLKVWLGLCEIKASLFSL